jgi:hypothetical protein
VNNIFGRDDCRQELQKVATLDGYSAVTPLILPLNRKETVAESLDELLLWNCAMEHPEILFPW